MTKTCRICSVEKPLQDFGVNKTYKDGLASKCKRCQIEYMKERHKDPEKRAKDRLSGLAGKVRRRWALRMKCLTYYGGSPPKCACCGESQVEFLQIDHINNDGAKHRKEIGGSGQMICWLRDNGFPPGYQIMCANCNSARSFYGRCPHQGPAPHKRLK